MRWKMNNIYFDKLPETIAKSSNKDDVNTTEVRMCFKSDVKISPLTDRLAEERKKVVSELKVYIRYLFNSYASSIIDYCIWNKNSDENQKLYNNFKRIINDRLVKVLDLFDKRIDQIERETDETN